MTLKRIFKITAIVLFLFLAAGIALFLYNANNQYNVSKGFMPVPLNFDPEDSSSTYTWHGSQITVYGGFVKGVQSGGVNGGSLIIRALSPLPNIEIKNSDQLYSRVMSITLENINPDFYAKQIDRSLSPSRTAVNTLEFTLDAKPNEEVKITPSEPSETDSDRYVILGDNRDGYDTFDQIIQQVNALKPIFVIDNGDLVYSGKPDQYRLFDKTVQKISTTLCITLGNHDVRRHGRDTYTMLYGPGYYSFDFGGSHFTFLDSSTGWSEKTAISAEQYTWLENDLQKAQGKNIYVITHIPPTDPRSGTTPNLIPQYIDKVKTDVSFEKLLDNYSENESMNHGFQDQDEAKKFESLMSEYGVKTVYLSHIHSYFDYTKDGVRYIITGGAGAELLTKDSYYHYLIANFNPDMATTMVELPSPSNTLIMRYGATIALFANAMYVENRTAVTLFLIGVIILALLLLTLIVLRLRHSKLWTLAKDTGKFTANRFQELYRAGRKKHKK